MWIYEPSTIYVHKVNQWAMCKSIALNLGEKHDKITYSFNDNYFDSLNRIFLFDMEISKYTYNRSPYMVVLAYIIRKKVKKYMLNMTLAKRDGKIIKLNDIRTISMTKSRIIFTDNLNTSLMVDPDEVDVFEIRREGVNVYE